MNHSDEIKRIRQVTWVGVGINLLLAVVKFTVGIVGKSQAVVADAVHSLSDMSTDFAVIFGVKFWSAPPDEDHPYGHRRIEALVTVAIGLLLAGVALGLGYKAVTDVSKDQFQQTTWIALWGPLVSIIFKELLYHWTISEGKKVNSSAVIANAWHHRSDALSSVPALVAVIVSAINPSLAFVDQIGAVIIALFILKVSWDIIRPALAELTDQGVSESSREKIKKIVASITDVQEVHKVRTRKVGPQVFVDLHVLVDPMLTVLQGHTIAEIVREQLIAQCDKVYDVVVHVEPFENT